MAGTVDLDALRRELEAVGVPAIVERHDAGVPVLGVYGEDEDHAFTVWPTGRWMAEFVADPLAIWWIALDIIRKHVTGAKWAPYGHTIGPGRVELLERLYAACKAIDAGAELGGAMVYHEVMTELEAMDDGHG